MDHIGLNIKIGNITSFRTKLGLTNYKKSSDESRSNICANIKKYLLDGRDELDGDKIAGDIFKSVKADVFLSHSHLDIDIVRSLAAWIETNLGLSVFVDCDVWGCANDLICNLIDEANVNDISDVQERNFEIVRLSSYAHCMINRALTEMIGKCKGFIFLNTINAVNVTGRTLSPWIAGELSTIKLLINNQAARNQNFGVGNENLITMSYKANLANLRIVDAEFLLKWKELSAGVIGDSDRVFTAMNTITLGKDICYVPQNRFSRRYTLP